MRSVDEDYLDDIAEGFAQVIDAKSPFTSGHSKRVALVTDLIAEELHLAPDRKRWLVRAALLHDLGKLGVSNEILDKPGKLDPAEWEIVRRHPGWGAEILSRMAAFSDLAKIARGHHERPDGRGYPQQLGGDAILRAEQLENGLAVLRFADVRAGPVAETEIIELPKELEVEVLAQAAAPDRAIGAPSEDAGAQSPGDGSGIPAQQDARNQRAVPFLP